MKTQTKTKRRAVKVRSLEEARALEAQIRAVRESFEREASPDDDVSELQDETIRIQRDADEEIQTGIRTLDELYNRIERTLGSRLSVVEQRVAGGTPETPETDPETLPANGQRGIEDPLSPVAALLRARGVVDFEKKSATEQRELLAKLANQQAREIEAVHARMVSKIGLPGFDGTSEAEEKKFDLVRAVSGYLNGWSGGEEVWPEKKLLDEYQAQLRAMGTTVSSAGGFFVAPTWMSDVIELLRPNTVALQLGMRTVPNLTGGPVTFPKIKGGATAYWVAEGKTGTKSQMSTGALNLTPRPIMVIVPISEDLIEAAADVEGVVTEDMGLAMGEAIDRGTMIGGGGDGQPLGIVNAPGVGTTDFSGIVIPTSTDYSGAANFQNVTDLLDDLIFQVAARNAYRGRPGFALHPLAVQKLRTVKDHGGKPLLFSAASDDPNASDASVGIGKGQLWGHPFGMTTQLGYGTNTDLLFGNWQDLLLGRWGATKILPSMEASDPGATDGSTSAYMQAEVWIRMRAKVDVGLRHGESFQIANGWAN